MLNRCENEHNHAFHLYGGRGIAVCKRWHDFTKFLADMGPKPTRSHSIERKDNNANYTPGNCKWATLAEQAVNKRRCIMVTLHDERMCLAQACRHLNLNYKNILQHYRRTGLPIDQVISSYRL